MSRVTDIIEANELCEAYMDGVDDGCNSCPYNGRCSELRQDTIDALEALDKRVPRWISVKERLPEVNTAVLLRARYCNSFKTHIGEVTDEGRWVRDWGKRIDKKRVTHWMPLPAPPEEEKHE